MLFIRKYLRKLIYRDSVNSIVPINKTNKLRNAVLIIGGKLNPDKVFYIIQRYPGTGLFSNLAFIVNHIQVANRMGFIPIVDMKNFPSIYNEHKKIFGTLNSWEYYFEQLTNYSLDEVYKSKNLIRTNSKFYRDEEFKNKITSSKNLLKIFNEKIKIKKTKFKTITYLKKKLFTGKKILGIHHRGTSFKTTEYPITINQMINIINEILQKDNYDKIFLVTEDIKNFNALTNYFKDKIICLKSSQKRKGDFDVWNKYPRPLHRYKLGRNILYETYLLSYCDGFFDIETNPREVAHALNLNPKQKRYTYDNGINSIWKYFKYLNLKWHIRSAVPEAIGGFKKNKKPN